MRTHKSLLPLLAIAALCLGWYGQPVNYGGVLIQPVQVTASRGLLRVHVNVMNQGQAPLSVVRDAVSVVLPTGQVVARSQGVTIRHNVYVIPPGQTQYVEVEFRSEGFNWMQYSPLVVHWENAISANGAAVAVPPMTLQQ